MRGLEVILFYPTVGSFTRLLAGTLSLFRMLGRVARLLLPPPSDGLGYPFMGVFLIAAPFTSV